MQKFRHYKNSNLIFQRFDYREALTAVLEKLKNFDQCSPRTLRIINNIDNENERTKELLTKLNKIPVQELKSRPRAGSFEAEKIYDTWHLQLNQALRQVATLQPYMENEDLDKIHGLTFDEVCELNDNIQALLLDYIRYKKQFPQTEEESKVTQESTIVFRYYPL
ncbi:MAG: hypothetical protein K0S11_917 [Gammaproteobacteria bacterium]|jgi:hypothetical protein|nr:hypothetical protein [Gammaproteobacteria bacterium]